MQYSEMFGTRLMPEDANQVRQIAARLQIGESAIVRLAVAHFLKCQEATELEPLIHGSVARTPKPAMSRESAARPTK